MVDTMNFADQGIITTMDLAHLGMDLAHLGMDLAHLGMTNTMNIAQKVCSITLYSFRVDDN